MAAPANKNVQVMSGKWLMNKQLSDDFDSILAFQGISWLTRKTIGLATITLIISQYNSPEDNLPHLDVDQQLTGGIKGTFEPRIMDWKMRPHKDAVFGEVEGQSRYVNPMNMEPGSGGEDKEWLGEGWEGDEQVQSWVRSVKGGWEANQIWGFRTFRGERRYCRKVLVTKNGGKERKQALLVYDYVGEKQ